MIEKASASVTSATLAIQRASASTGADFDFLMRTAARESGFNANAKASTSTATGLFQFIEQSWLGMMKLHGAEHGMADLADKISITRNGRYVVADRQAKADILALRTDPEVAAIMAGEFSEDARAALKNAIGRNPTDGELYTAHLLGPAGAIQLIAGAARGETSAAAMFPEAARANRALFYTKGGAARSPTELIALMGDKHRSAKVPGSVPAADDDALMLASMRGTTDSMDDVVSTAYAPVMAGRAAYDTDNYGIPDYASMGSGRPAYDIDNAGVTDGSLSLYTAEVSPSVVTPFMAQLLASLDPIPDKVRDAMFRVDAEMDGAEDKHA